MRAILLMSSGVIVWALHFAAIYGFTALACARGFPQAVPWVVAIATAAAVAAVLFFIVVSWKQENHDFEAWMTRGIAGFALVAILWEAIPVWVVPTCA